MKNIILISLLTCSVWQVSANVNYVDINKISSDSKLVTAFNFIKSNTSYYDHWTNNWTYDKPKKSLIAQLREYYKSFAALKTKNEETYLLLGDISHYLYNMDDQDSYEPCVKNYEAAIGIDPKDYRAYWFLGIHYALSNEPVSGIDNFLKAEKLLPSPEPADFWNEYAWASVVANMPSHSIYAMDKVKSILGKEGSVQQSIGESIYKNIVTVDKDQSYDKKDIWSGSSGGEKTTFTSRPLGIKIAVDSTWDLSVYNYEKNQAAFIMVPPTIANKQGKEIHYTIAILMRTPLDGEKLEDYINLLTGSYAGKKKIQFSNKYDNIVAYEIKDSNMYKEIGGAHMYMVGIERSAPKYPGLLLESAATMPNGNPGAVTYYKAGENKNRFTGRIFYALLLDSCEDIHEQSFSIFKSLFENQVVIE